MSSLERILASRAVQHAVSLSLGVAIGIFFHYLLFRLSLPIQPFIYVSF